MNYFSISFPAFYLLKEKPPGRDPEVSKKAPMKNSIHFIVTVQKGIIFFQLSILPVFGR